MKTTLYFGVDISEEQNAKYNYLDIIARLFASPRISREYAVTLLSALEAGSVTVDRINIITDSYIKELLSGQINDIALIMSDKLIWWECEWGVPTDKDYLYLENSYGITRDMLFGRRATKQFDSPRALADEVKQHIKGQDHAVATLAVPFFQHLERKRAGRNSNIISSVLAIGETGVGKSETYLQFARLCDCPVIRINTAEVTATGWKGTSINNIIAQEYISGRWSIDELSYAVLVLCEFDKLISRADVKTSDGDSEGALIRDIMRLFEHDSPLKLECGLDTITMTNKIVELSTDNLLIMFDGAFYGLEDIVKKRLRVPQNSIGFGRKIDSTNNKINYLQYVADSDLIEWGYPKELLGRMGYRCVLNPLTADLIYQIMTETKNSIVKEHIEYCKGYNVTLLFQENALRYIAEMAAKSGLGFRNARTLMSKVMVHIYYELKYNEENIIINITKEYVQNQLLDQSQIITLKQQIS